MRAKEEPSAEPIRLTQLERSARTRERLFRATIQVAVDSGFDALSTRRVASVAGMTMGAIYAHFDGREALIQGAMEWYRAHAPEFDIPDATSLREFARRRLKATFEMAVSADESTRTIVRFQQELDRLEQIDPAIRELCDRWNEARIARVCDRLVQICAEAGEQLHVSAQRLAEQIVYISGVLATHHLKEPLLLPESAALAAIDSLVDDALGIRRPADRDRRRRRRPS